EAGDAHRETDRIRTMPPTRGEGEPAKPQEGQEFNREKSNSKARTPSVEESAESDGVEKDREPDGAASNQHATDPGTACGGRHDGAGGDEGPVARLEAVKIRARGHSVRTAAACRSARRSCRPHRSSYRS